MGALEDYELLYTALKKRDCRLLEKLLGGEDYVSIYYNGTYYTVEKNENGEYVVTATKSLYFPQCTDPESGETEYDVRDEVTGIIKLRCADGVLKGHSKIVVPEYCEEADIWFSADAEIPDSELGLPFSEYGYMD